MNTVEVPDIPDLDVDIPDLHPGETVKIVLRRHWIVFVRTFFYFFTLVFIVLLLLTLQAFLSNLFWISSYFMYVLILFLSSCFLIFIYLDWINQELDVFVITSKRVIAVEQISFLNRTISECSLSDVQEVNANTQGLLANIFHFGSISIQTASEKSDFNLDTIAYPLDNARNVLNVVHRYKEMKTMAVRIEQPKP